MKDMDALERMYRKLQQSGGAMAGHMFRLRELAREKDVVEFGVKRGHSTVALLCSARSLVSVDINRPAAADMEAWAKAAGGIWAFVQGDTREIDIPACDFLLIDADHTYRSVEAELRRHGQRPRQYLAFHDTITFGSIGAAGESGQHSWTYVKGQSVPPEHLGIRPAIDDFMAANWDWRVERHYPDHHGLLVLRRLPL